MPGQGSMEWLDANRARMSELSVKSKRLVREAKEVGYREGLEKSKQVTRVLAQQDSIADMTEAALEKVTAALECGDLEALAGLNGTLKALLKERQDMLKWMYGAPVSRQQVEVTKITADVSIRELADYGDDPIDAEVVGVEE